MVFFSLCGIQGEILFKRVSFALFLNTPFGSGVFQKHSLRLFKRDEASRIFSSYHKYNHLSTVSTYHFEGIFFRLRVYIKISLELHFDTQDSLHHGLEHDLGQAKFDRIF